MKLNELKKSIKDNSLSDSLLVFKYEDNSFLAFQYMREIAKNKNLDILYIDDLQESLSSSSLFSQEDNYLYVINSEKFETNLNDFVRFKNVIIICKTIKDNEELEKYSVLFPKLKDWQIIEYMKESCKGLTNDEISWIFTETKGDIYRIDNELSKIKLFPREKQEDIFIDIDSNGGYSDLSHFNIFNLTTAIMKNDINTIKDILIEADNIDIEGTGLATLMHKNIKNVIDIQMNRNATPKSLGMSDKQFKAISYNCGKYSANKLIKMFDFITSIDYKLKSGDLSITNSRIVDYIVCNLLN